MKTCEDCIHYDVCDIPVIRAVERIGIELTGSKLCNDFKDKSKFIELPCSIGDTVYTILYYNVHETKVVCIRPFIFKNRIEYRGNVVVTIADLFYSDGSHFEQERFVVFGEDTFLTREEAEKKLEGLNNDN